MKAVTPKPAPAAERRSTPYIPPALPSTPLSSIRSEKLRNELVSTLRKRRALDKKIKSLETAKKDLLDIAVGIAEKLDLERISSGSDVGDWTLMKIRQEKVSLDMKKLLENGVSLTVIERSSTKKKSEFWRVDYVKPKKASGDNNEEDSE